MLSGGSLSQRAHLAKLCVLASQVAHVEHNNTRFAGKIIAPQVFSRLWSQNVSSDWRRVAKVIMSDCTGNGNCNDCTGDSSVSCGNVDGGSVVVSSADGGDGLADWANVLIALAGVIVAILALIGVKCACDNRRDRSRTGSGGGATTGQEESKAAAV